MPEEKPTPPERSPREKASAFSRTFGGEDPLPTDPDLSAASLRHTTRQTASVVALVGLGGFVGTFGRYGLEAAWRAAGGQLPWATLVINTTGALLLGLLVELALLLPHRGFIRPLFGTGLLGGWTTYSTFAVEAVVLAKGKHLGVAAAYVGTSFVAGGLAVAVGVAAGRWLRGGRHARPGTT